MGTVTVKGDIEITVNGRSVNTPNTYSQRGNEIDLYWGANNLQTLNSSSVSLGTGTQFENPIITLGSTSRDEIGFGLTAFAKQYGYAISTKGTILGIGGTPLAVGVAAGVLPCTWSSCYNSSSNSLNSWDLAVGANVYGLTTNQNNVPCQYFWSQQQSPDGVSGYPGNVNINSNVLSNPGVYGEQTWGTDPSLGGIAYQSEFGPASNIPWVVLLTDQANQSENGVYYVTYAGYKSSWRAFNWVKAPDWDQFRSQYTTAGGKWSVVEIYKLPQQMPNGAYGYSLPPQPPIQPIFTQWNYNYDTVAMFRMEDKNGINWTPINPYNQIGFVSSVLKVPGMFVAPNGVVWGNDGKQLYINSSTYNVSWRPDWPQIQPATGTWWSNFSYPSLGGVSSNVDQDDATFKVNASHEFQPTASVTLLDGNGNIVSGAQVDLYINGTDYVGTWHTTSTGSTPVNINIWGGENYPIGAQHPTTDVNYCACGIFNATLVGTYTLYRDGQPVYTGAGVPIQAHFTLGETPTDVASKISAMLSGVSVSATYAGPTKSSFNIYINDINYAMRSGGQTSFADQYGGAYPIIGQCAYPDGWYKLVPKTLTNTNLILSAVSNGNSYTCPKSLFSYLNIGVPTATIAMGDLLSYLETLPGPFSQTLEELDNYYLWTFKSSDDPLPNVSLGTIDPSVSLGPMRAVITFASGTVFDNYNPPLNMTSMSYGTRYGGVQMFPITAFDYGYLTVPTNSPIGTPTTFGTVAGYPVIRLPKGLNTGSGSGTGSSDSDNNVYGDPIISTGGGLYVGDAAANQFDQLSGTSLSALAVNKDSNTIYGVNSSGSLVRVMDSIAGTTTTVSSLPSAASWSIKPNTANQRNLLGVYVNNGNLYFQQSFDDGANWQASVEIDNSGTITGKGSIFCLDGLIVVIWSSGSDLKCTTSVDGVTFGSPVTIATGAYNGITCVHDIMHNVYVLAQDASSTPHLYKSGDQGASWSEISATNLPEIDLSNAAQTLACWVMSGALAIVAD